MKSLIICLAFLLFSNTSIAEPRHNYFLVIDKNTDVVYKTKRIKIDETRNIISFVIFCENNVKCGSVIKGNKNSYFIKNQ